MPPLLPLEQKLVTAWPADRWGDVRVVVAVSGGPDSVALLRALARLGEGRPARLAAAHFNHRMRGENATADQRFVVDLCRSLAIDCVVGEAEANAAALSGEGLESTLRAARYAFLTRTAEQLGARYVATGHTADDQAETILHHILRGTGLRGLAGMRRVRSLSRAVTLVRPMLAIGRGEVLDYLGALAQSYRHDETNEDRGFLRNRIRHELVPLLARDYSATIVDSLLRLGALAADAQGVIEGLGESLLAASTLESNATGITIDCRKLRTSERHLVREALIAAWRRQGWSEQSMGYAQWNLLADMAVDAAGDRRAPQELPGGVRARRDGDRLRIGC